MNIYLISYVNAYTHPELSIHEYGSGPFHGSGRKLKHQYVETDLEYDDGMLILHGRLGSYYQKQLAQETVAGVEGVVQVVNEIEVVDHQPGG